MTLTPEQRLLAERALAVGAALLSAYNLYDALRTGQVTDKVPGDVVAWSANPSETPKRTRVLADRTAAPVVFWAYAGALGGLVAMIGLFVASRISLALLIETTLLGAGLWSLYVMLSTGEAYTHSRSGRDYLVGERKSSPISYWAFVLLLAVLTTGVGTVLADSLYMGA